MNENDLIQAIASDGIIRVAGLLSLLMPESGGVGFGVKGLDGRYRLANRMLDRLLCQGSGRVDGRSESDLLPAHLREQLARCDQALVDGAPVASTEVLLPVDSVSSHCLWLKLPILGADGKLKSIASIVHQVSQPHPTTAMQQTLACLEQANQELRRTVVELEQVASTDKLTGAWNRRRLEESVRTEMDRLNRYEHPLSLLIVDIDFFKVVNDQHGHATGDQVLRELTKLLHDTLRGTDSLARWGGEEFVVICPNTRRVPAGELAERLREQVAGAIFPVVGQVTVSIGVAECSLGESWEDWFARADEALYQAKGSGRNQVQLAPAATTADDAQAPVAANFVHLVWRSAYDCGDEVVDRGHRLLFANANGLLSAILSGHSADGVDAQVDSLIADVLQHFGDEEKVIVAAGFPGATEHIVLHRELVAKAAKLVDEYRAGKQGLGDMFQFLAYEVITKHMLGADRQFFPYLRADRPEVTSIQPASSSRQPPWSHRLP
ncbi:diguanylate cyclase [Candidatus Accumulibacter aalborgensis]|uniref:diguanylate cyclase n=1 Tax=Candidatus Accumulibacter aalborgensis TaxID=1860102 RepID=UPI001647B4AD|nr:diguanylate cyclase [Candidatus Accumulibacter aalborgensis]